MDNKYKEMWDILKQKVNKRYKEYECGDMMSMSESVWGAAIYNDMKEIMESMEKDFGC